MHRPLAYFLLLWALALRAAAPSDKTIVLVSGEAEYHSSETLPAFKKILELEHGFRCVYLEARGSNDLPGIEALQKADLLILFMRRTTLPEEQLNQFKEYFNSGRPVIGLRTASHAFQNWLEFDALVLGGHYGNHHDKKLEATIRKIKEADSHPILKGIPDEFKTAGSLYRNSPLPAGSRRLLVGTVPGQPEEPVAWTHEYKGARVFYTSLGHPSDFDDPAFRTLLVNAIYWALALPPKK